MPDGQPVNAEPEMLEPQDALLRFLGEEDGEAPVAEDTTEEPQDEDEPDTPAEDEPDESGDEESDEVAEDEQGEAPRSYRVKVDGEEVEVTEDELVRGYSRQQDYTRKTMKLAEERKALEAEADRVKTERTQYVERLEAMKAFLDANMGQEPDWDALRAEDPAGYAAKYADWQRQQNAKAKVEAEQARVQQKAMEEQRAQLETFVTQERERLLEAIPEWKDPSAYQQGQRALITYGEGLGFSEQELASLVDHRTVVVLNKARLYDELMAKGKTVKEKAAKAPVLKPGAKKPVPTKRNTVKDRALDRFKKTGKPQDAAALLETMLDDL